MRRHLLTATAIAVALPAAVVPAVTTASPADAAAALPGSISAVSARPGPYAGQVTFSWTASGANTTSFVIETGLTTFKVGDPVLPDHGRQPTYFTISPGRRSITLTAAQVASAGARASSANHLYYRFKAVNRTASGTATRSWPYLQNVAVKQGTPSSAGVPLRVATYNVHTATATSGVRPWTVRAPGIARTILSRNPGVASLQELGIGRADGSSEPTTVGSLNQIQALLDALAAQGGSRYRLVRSTRFVAPGTPEGIQGARILYDSTRYRLVSSCPERSDSKPITTDSYSASCTILLPTLSGDNAWVRRRASYALLADRSTGRQFWVVSAHLDQRHSSTATTERIYERLRATQAKAVLARMDQLNTSGLPIVLAGDLNTYQNNQGGYDAHDALVAAGYYDTAAAVTQVNVRYTTMNHFACTLSVPGSGWGSRLDVVTVKGVWGAPRWENVMAVSDCSRPSDHNMVVTDIRIP